MKQRLWRSIKIAIIVFIVLSSGLASYIHWEAAGFDPIRGIHRLRSQGLRDEAFELVNFLKGRAHGKDPEVIASLKEELEGKICYRVSKEDGEVSCACGDFARNIRQDQNFRCKHIVSVQNCVSKGDLENGTFLERKKPKLDERFITTIEGKDFVMYSPRP